MFTYKLNIDNKIIKFFQKKILGWFALNGRKFPWRKKNLSNYQKVIAEVLLQRTKAETVAKFYDKFIHDFPSWTSLVLAEREKIEEYLKPLGLYRQRSTLLLKLANEMLKRGGRLPKERTELESIPFMGQYIANSVKLLVHNTPSPLLDVNMVRVLERFFGPREMADIRYDPYLQDLALKVVNIKESKKINWAILDFAAKICRSRNPKCEICILRYRCSLYDNLINNKAPNFVNSS